MSEFFTEYKTIIVFLHVISAVVWVGGMIAMKFAAHASFMEVESPQKRLQRVAHALKRLFFLVIPFVIILLVTAIIMTKAYSLSQSEYAMLAYAKEGIWSVMAINLFIMILRRNRAEKLIDKGDMVGAKFSLELIGKYMVPVNIILGVSAIFIGSYFSSNL
ncbi:Uncharacterized membrane protein [Epsilonproteobacteria bacterium SCGC AD-311-C15]|jgi:uncharacterized membrane protein|nr:Uncharacterized membrane protein [Epsilonproteobacteria bacterium SCGC AD-311-C15]